jgi:hypothetical protein
MIERKENNSHSENISPSEVAESVFINIGELVTDNMSIKEAKRIALEYGMVQMAEFILVGGSSNNRDERTLMLAEGSRWLEAITQVYNNNWSELLNKITVLAMVAEDFTDDEPKRKKSVQAIYKLKEKILGR